MARFMPVFDCQKGYCLVAVSLNNPVKTGKHGDTTNRDVLSHMIWLVGWCWAKMWHATRNKHWLRAPWSQVSYKSSRYKIRLASTRLQCVQPVRRAASLLDDLSRWVCPCGSDDEPSTKPVEAAGCHDCRRKKKEFAPVTLGKMCLMTDAFLQFQQGELWKILVSKENNAMPRPIMSPKRKPRRTSLLCWKISCCPMPWILKWRSSFWRIGRPPVPRIGGAGTKQG